MHPRNRHKGRYDFSQLVQASPELEAFVRDNPKGDRSIDFSDPDAVKALNLALLRRFYAIQYWDIPEGYLCPPIPGRADYIHTVADLVRQKPGDHKVRVLDIGTGANLIYPIIGNSEYGWTFVGSEIDSVALDSARKIVDLNPKLSPHVELRFQKNPNQFLKTIIQPIDQFDLVICNPPFHASFEEAKSASNRKWKKLNRTELGGSMPLTNFGGRHTELWFPGGERAFIVGLVKESVTYKDQVTWYSCLVSKESNIPAIRGILHSVKARSFRFLDMNQGQKKSRIVAWTFKDLPI